MVERMARGDSRPLGQGNVVELINQPSDALARLLAAAAGPARPGELRDERQARVLYSAGVSSWASRRRWNRRSSGVAALVSTACLLAGTSGLAAATALPTPAARVVDRVLQTADINVEPGPDSSGHTSVAAGAGPAAGTIGTSGAAAHSHGSEGSGPCRTAAVGTIAGVTTLHAAGTGCAAPAPSPTPARTVHAVGHTNSGAATPVAPAPSAGAGVTMIHRTGGDGTRGTQAGSTGGSATAGGGSSGGAGSGNAGSGTGTGTGTNRGGNLGTGTNRGGNLGTGSGGGKKGGGGAKKGGGSGNKGSGRHHGTGTTGTGTDPTSPPTTIAPAPTGP